MMPDAPMTARPNETRRSWFAVWTWPFSDVGRRRMLSVGLAAVAFALATYVIAYFGTLKIAVITTSDPVAGVRTSIPVRTATIGRYIPHPVGEMLESCFLPAYQLDRWLRPRTWSLRQTSLTPAEIQSLGGR